MRAQVGFLQFRNLYFLRDGEAQSEPFRLLFDLGALGGAVHVLSLKRNGRISLRNATVLIERERVSINLQLLLRFDLYVSHERENVCIGLNDRARC